jgi:hypothetical protein
VRLVREAGDGEGAGAGAEVVLRDVSATGLVRIPGRSGRQYGGAGGGPGGAGGPG